jgi:hypothetical protein
MMVLALALIVGVACSIEAYALLPSHGPGWRGVVHRAMAAVLLGALPGLAAWSMLAHEAGR